MNSTISIVFVFLIATSFNEEAQSYTLLQALKYIGSGQVRILDGILRAYTTADSLFAFIRPSALVVPSGGVEKSSVRRVLSDRRARVLNMHASCLSLYRSVRVPRDMGARRVQYVPVRVSLPTSTVSSLLSLPL